MMKDELLTMFEYAVENNLWDLIRGLYPEVINSYRSKSEIIRYAEEAMKLMAIRQKHMREEYDNEGNGF